MTTNLRIVRKSEWVLDTSQPLMIGGPSAWKLERTDTLQYETEDGSWLNVPVTMLPVPEHPNAVRERSLSERINPWYRTGDLSAQLKTAAENLADKKKRE